MILNYIYKMSNRQYNITASNYGDFYRNDLETINKSSQEMLVNMQNRVLPEHKERLNYDILNRNLEISNNFKQQSSVETQQPPQSSHQQFQPTNKNISVLDRALVVNQQYLPVDFNGRLEYDNMVNKKDKKNENDEYKHVNTQNNNQFYGATGVFRK